MVRLQKLVMQGFKSFSKKTVVPLYPGFNAVIGPNGSGKSNIIDALVFVLGTSSRNLRAERLQHVIYNGGHGKKPADAAIVSLVLDNSDKTLDGAENLGELILISRRVNRRGNSVYRLNGKAVNRRKILDVMSLAHIDPEGYNIIQQGDVTAIIEMRPKERRSIIDEAAGIKEYNEKKEKALKELEVAERNVGDVDIVLAQKKEFLDRLKADRDGALKYKEIEKNLDFSKATLAFTRVKGVEGTLENVTRNLNVKLAEFGAAGGKVDTFDSDLQKIESEAAKIGGDIIKKSINAEAKKEVDEITSKILKRESQIEANRREIERLEEMIAKLTKISQSQSMGGINASVDAILEMRKGGVYGAIANLYRAQPKYETALDVAFGGHLNDVIVDSESNAIECVNYLKSRGLGRVRFLPIGRLQKQAISAKAELASKMPGVIDFAINLLRFDKKYEAAFRDVLKETLIAEDTASARKIRGLRVVTLEGELFEAGGAIVGGTLKLRKRMHDGQGQAGAGGQGFQGNGGGNGKESDLTDVSEYEKAKDRLEGEIAKLKKEIGEFNILLEEKTKSEKKESKDVVALEEKRKQLLDDADRLKRERRSRYEQKLNLEAEINELKLRKARLETELSGILVDYEKYKDRTDLAKGDPSKLEHEIRNYERQIRALGIVNLKAIEEFDALEKDYNSIKEKLDKLKGERNSISEMIRQIEDKRKVVFMAALDAVSSEFRKVYLDLAGGEAEILLENQSDIESGLIIKAQPKDKKLISIDSLSGGEKTMAALAFLFAIQRFRPSPFYILDEIDAALDKHNAEKVGAMITKYASEAQFIMISHNEVTVRKAERIYGVSMQKGVSQVLGIELKENNALEAKPLAAGAG